MEDQVVSDPALRRAETELSVLRALAARLEPLARNAQSNAIVPRRAPAATELAEVGENVDSVGLSQALLVGTEESFLCLARRLIEIVCEAREAADEPPDSSVSGQSVYTAVDLGLSFDEFSPVYPVHAYLAADEKAAQRVTNALAAGQGLATGPRSRPPVESSSRPVVETLRETAQER
jgi:hypothetical protein